MKTRHEDRFLDNFKEWSTWCWPTFSARKQLPEKWPSKSASRHLHHLMELNHPTGHVSRDWLGGYNGAIWLFSDASVFFNVMIAVLIIVFVSSFWPKYKRVQFELERRKEENGIDLPRDHNLRAINFFFISVIYPWPQPEYNKFLLHRYPWPQLEGNKFLLTRDLPVTTTKGQ